MSSSSSIKSRFKLFIVLAALGAVSFGVPFLAQAKKAKRAPASTADCKTDKDCVLVADDCCPCSQGGKQRAIPKKQKDAYEKDRKKRCADTACTEQVSSDPSCSQKPFCGAGICELGGDDAPPPADAAPSGL
ncbi:MAG TPA: hypothetical protein VHO06_14250 [Polyangia bacterium]|nr:hypothetical protein [Polyangia bacterium]